MGTFDELAQCISTYHRKSPHAVLSCRLPFTYLFIDNFAFCLLLLTVRRFPLLDPISLLSWPNICCLRSHGWRFSHAVTGRAVLLHESMHWPPREWDGACSCHPLCFLSLIGILALSGAEREKSHLVCRTKLYIWPLRGWGGGSESLCCYQAKLQKEIWDDEWIGGSIMNVLIQPMSGWSKVHLILTWTVSVKAIASFRSK